MLRRAAKSATEQGTSHLLQGIDCVAQPDDRVLLTLRLADVAPETRVVTVDQPARISIDLPDTALALSQTRHVVGVGDVTTVDAVEADGRTRVVIALRRTAPYTLRRDGNKLYVVIENPAVATAANPPSHAAIPCGSTVSTLVFLRVVHCPGLF